MYYIIIIISVGDTSEKIITKFSLFSRFWHCNYYCGRVRTSLGVAQYSLSDGVIGDKLSVAVILLWDGYTSPVSPLRRKGFRLSYTIDYNLYIHKYISYRSDRRIFNIDKNNDTNDNRRKKIAIVDRSVPARGQSVFQAIVVGATVRRARDGVNQIGCR